MREVQAVCGPVGPDALGHCQIHEHIFVRWTPMAEQAPALRFEDSALSLRELKDYRAHGGRSLVDAQPVAAGRDALALEALSRESGVTVIASTGYHLLGFYPKNCWVHALGEDGLYALYRTELEEGMLPWSPDAAARPQAVTGVRAGMVKAAIPAEGPVGRYAVLLRAAARAAARTNTPLMLHTERGQHALEALEICFRAGVKPEKLVVCHVDRQAADRRPHEAVADTGVFLDYDTIGRFKYHSDQEEAALIKHMAARGHGDRLLLALDTTAARLAAYGGEIGLTYLFDSFYPLLRKNGLDEAAIRRCNQENCRRLFAG